MMATRQSIQAALLLAVVASASAFSPLSATQSTRFSRQHQLHLLQPQSATIPSARRLASLPQPAYRSPLFQQHRQQLQPSGDNTSSNSNNPLQRLKSLLQVFHFRAWWTALLRVQVQLRRAAVILAASAMIWMGTSAVSAPPASAASSATANVLERIMPSADSDKIINRYVRHHMFDDDDASHQDPLESAYREAFEDYNTKGSYPKAIKDITAEVMGSSSVAKTNDGEGSMGVIGTLTSGIRFMERRGLSETTALLVIAATLVVAAPSMLLLFGMIVGGISKRNMNKLMKQRYGETYTVDATVKQEPDVEAPEDEDDDDEDDDADEDDDEDDDDDDE